MTKNQILEAVQSTLEQLAGERVAQGGSWPDGTVRVAEAVERLKPLMAQASTDWLPNETYGQHADRLGEGPCRRCVGHAVTGATALRGDPTI